MTLAFPASTDFSQLNAKYGDELPLATLDPSQGITKTIVGFQDRSDSIALRAGIIGETAIPTTLTDGRLALAGTFSDALLAAKTSLGITELTQDQLTALLPKSQP